MTDFEKARDKAAEAYSAEQFAQAESFSVMRDVCNDEIYIDAFIAGADWALNGEVVRGMRDALKSGCYCGSSPYGEKDWCECCVALAAFDSAVSEGGE